MINWTNAGEHAPQILVVPRGAVSLDEAHAAIELWEFYSGKQLDFSQRLAVEVMMATGTDGRWAAQTTGREMARQNGKGDEIEVVELWGLVMRAEAILHTVHDAVLLATETQERMLGLFQHRDMRGKVLREWKGTGQQMIELRNGGQIWYRTRTKGGGRGLDQIDRVVVDEAQHAKRTQMAAILPTMSMASDPQMNALGTGALAGESDWWWDIRIRAISEDPGQFGYVGHTAEKVRLNDAGEVEQTEPDVTDRSQWLKANPAYASGRGGGLAFLEEEFRNLGPDLFAREHLCVWDPPSAMMAGRAKIDPHWWRECADRKAEILGRVVVAVATTFDLDSSAVDVCGRQADGRRHVEVVQHDAGSHWVELALLDVLAQQQVAVVAFDASGPSKALRPMLERVIADHNRTTGEDVQLEPLSLGRYKAACAAWVADIKATSITHAGDTRLGNLAVQVPGRRLGDDGWIWDNRVGDVTPLNAATVAAAVADSLPEPVVAHAYEGPLVTFR